MAHKRTFEEIERRLVLCTMVAERLARIILQSPIVARVGMYGSVARRTPGHWCSDVDLMAFVTVQVEGLAFLHRHGAHDGRVVLDLGLDPFREEIQVVTRGFATPEDMYRMPWMDAPIEDREALVAAYRVPASLHILPERLDTDAACAFQAAQKDPAFLVNVGHDFKVFDPEGGHFYRQDPPWYKLPWQERLPEWREEREGDEIGFRIDSKSISVGSGLKVLGMVSYQEDDEEPPF